MLEEDHLPHFEEATNISSFGYKLDVCVERGPSSLWMSLDIHEIGRQRGVGLLSQKTQSSNPVLSILWLCANHWNICQFLVYFSGKPWQIISEMILWNLSFFLIIIFQVTWDMGYNPKLQSHDYSERKHKPSGITLLFYRYEVCTWKPGSNLGKNNSSLPKCQRSEIIAKSRLHSSKKAWSSTTFILRNGSVSQNLNLSWF